MKLAPKGMRDILPEDAIVRRHVFETVEKVFRKYGFVPLETPAMEYLETLNAKAGEEIDKQIFVLKGEELGLRFDLTVPLARVAANNAFAKPFKRYVFAPVWRYEEPQRGRFREFWQADIDTIGSGSMRSEAELLTAAREALLALGFKELRIVLNSRKILDALAAKLGIEGKKEAVFRLLDKIDKAGEEKVKAELNEVIGKEKTKELFKILDTKGDNKKKLEAAGKISPDGAAELEEILSLCDFDVEINLTLVRGLGYYTGPVFEIKGSEGIGSIAGGGRYDKLLGIYGQEDYATGISLGIERIITLLKEMKKESSKTYTKVLVANVKPEFYKNALGTAQELRNGGIAAEVDLNCRNLRKQFDYANALGIKYVVILGEREIKEKKFTLRDMASGKEKSVSLKDLVKELE
jgi:histidyl-tRNA synthetase